MFVLSLTHFYSWEILFNIKIIFYIENFVKNRNVFLFLVSGCFLTTRNCIAASFFEAKEYY